MRIRTIKPEGSSPLTRGKRAGAANVHVTAGLIPAHAGKTPTRAPRTSEPEAHPRSRGENIIAMRVSRSPLGSSPLTRGKQEQVSASGKDLGLIPAHAGKT